MGLDDLYGVGGEEFGGCGSGLNDCLTLLYLPIAVASSLLLPLIVEFLVGEVSEIPLLWPALYW